MPSVTPEDGIYRIRNAKALESFLTMDVSLARTPTYVFGYTWTDSPTQKWLVRNMGTEGYTLKNIGTDKYLSVKRDPKGGDLVYGTQTPTQWTFWHTKVVASACRLFVRGTSMNIDLHNWGDATPGTEVELWNWENDNDRPQQCWFPEKLDEQETASRASELTEGLIRLLSQKPSSPSSQETTPNPPPSSASDFGTLGGNDTRASTPVTPVPNTPLAHGSDRGSTNSTSETATVTVTEDEDFVVTTRTTEVRTTVVTRVPKPATTAY